MWKKLKIAICEPRRAMISLWMRVSYYLPDKLYLSVLYRLKKNRWIDWRRPRTFNEKLQWLKLYNRKSEYTQMVDKYAVKEYVAKLIGKEYIIPTLGVWDRIEDVAFDTLPDQFVLKTTHGGGSGGVVVCKDKANFDCKAAKIKLQQSMNSDIYRNFREWPYKHVQRRIIAEKYMVDESGLELKDYKFFCFNGIPKFCQVIANRTTDETIDFYDENWIHQPFVGLNPAVTFRENEHLKPHNYDEMLSIASKIGQDIPFARVDLYNINGKIYFGEITFFPAAGLGRFEPEEWDYIFGNWIKLPDFKKL